MKDWIKVVIVIAVFVGLLLFGIVTEVAKTVAYLKYVFS